MKKCLIVIPARMDSTRFFGKPLCNILGKPMIQRVWELASKANIDKKIIIATDDEKILAIAKDFNAEAMLTSKNCKNGTERVFEIAKAYPEYEYIFSLQGDTPLLPSIVIEKTFQALLESLPQLQLSCFYKHNPF